MQRQVLVPLASLTLLLAACPGGGDAMSDSGDSLSGSSGINISSTGVDTGSTSEPDPTTGGPGGSSSGGESTTEPVIDCGMFMPPPIMPVIPRVMLVLDKSGSMIAKGKTDEPGEVGDGFWDHDADPNTPEVTRWMSLHAVVESIFSGLDGVIQFGAALFPSTSAQSAYNELACLVDDAPLVQVGPMTGAQILAAIPGADSVSLAGGTPATAGMQLAIDELKGLQDEEPKFVVLITDGAANCRGDAANNTERFEQYDDNLPVVVADAAAMGIPTYVIGIDILDLTSPMITDGNPDDTNTYVKLNELAEAGGTARPGDEKFFNASNQIELQAALMEITEAIVSCEIPLGQPVPKGFYIQQVEVGADGDPGQLVYDGKDTQVADCASESGWEYTSETRDTIVLCGAACDHYKETGEINIVYGCIQF